MFETLASEVVTNGIEALNTLKPRWLDEMPLDVRCIDFMSPNSCPLHYVYGDFADGAFYVKRAGFDIQSCGFAEPHGTDRLGRAERPWLYAAVNAEWHARIKALRGDQS